MANTKISQLTANTNPTGNEELVYAYNNTNGKMTTNTLKTFVQPDLSGYQEKLISWTNIKTINNSSILWSWNIDISWWGGGNWQFLFDAVVASDGSGDFTTVSAALADWKSTIYVRKWSYTDTTWDATNRNVMIVWERWATITFSELTSTWTTGYVMRVSTWYNYYLEWLKFIVTSWHSFFSSYQNTNWDYRFKVVDCDFNISTIDKMFYSWWLDIYVNSNEWLNERFNPSVNWFFWCKIKVTTSDFTLSDTWATSQIVPYTRCYISWINFGWNREFWEDCVVNATSIRSDLRWRWNTFNIKAKHSSATAVELSWLYDSHVNFDSTFTDKIIITYCDNIYIYCDWTPSELDITRSSKWLKITVNNSTTVKCSADLITWCDFDLANNSIFTLDWSQLVFVWNNVWSNNTTTTNVLEVKECAWNTFPWAINIWENWENNFVHFSNNACWSDAACTIYATNGIITGNKFGTEAYSKPVTFKSWAVRNVFSANYCYSISLESWANNNIVTSNMLYGSSSVSDSWTWNMKNNNLSN